MKIPIMKTVFLFCVISLLSFMARGQNVFDRSINFEYIRLPQHPLPKSVKNYQAGVVLEYEEEIAARKEAFAKAVADAERAYEYDVKNYDRNVKEAGKRYAQDMAAWKINQRTNPTAPEPVLILPPKPEKILPVDDYYYPKVQNQDYLSATYINLDGYTKSPENSLLIKVMLRGFQYSEPELRISEVSKTKDGVTYKEKEYYYEISYKYPMGLKIEVPGAGIKCNEYFEELNRYSTFRSNKYKSDTLLLAAFNKFDILKDLEEKVLVNNMRYINEYMNNNFGYSKVSAREDIFLVTEKKHSYPDFKQAFEAVALGFGQLSADVNRTVAAQNLNAGVGLWESALKESQPKNKKARVNENVTTAALFNIALVSIYANEFGKAEIYLNKIFASDASKKEQRRVEQIKSFMKAQKQRYDAYISAD